MLGKKLIIFDLNALVFPGAAKHGARKSLCYTFVDGKWRYIKGILFMQITSLSNLELIEALKRIVRKEHEATLELIAYLIELDSRRLYLDLGYGSLFAYLTSGLKYSEPAANRRITVARCLRKFPEVFELLKNKELSLSGICLFGRFLTQENKETILGQVRGKSHSEIERIISGFKPRQEIRESIKPISLVAQPGKQKFLAAHGQQELSEAQSQVGPLGLSACGLATDLENLPSTSTVSPTACNFKEISEAQRDLREEKLIQKFMLKFTVSQDCMKQLEQVKSILSGKFPSGVSLENILNELLKFYLEKQSTKRRPKNPNSAPGKRIYISKALRQKILKDAGHCCSYKGPGGVKCNNTHDLEIDHINPLGKGGSNQACNLRVLCAKHNRLLAERHFGKEFVRQRIDLRISRKQETFSRNLRT